MSSGTDHVLIELDKSPANNLVFQSLSKCLTRAAMNDTLPLILRLADGALLLGNEDIDRLLSVLS